MQKVWLTTKNQGGFSLVEVLLAATIFGMLATVLISAIVFARASTANAGNRLRAVQYAEEGLEAARNIRDSGYASLTDGTYGLVQSGGVWTLSGSSDTSSIYTRSITIATSGTSRKTVTSNVTWPQTASTGSVSVVAELTNWTTTITSWANALLAGSYNAAGNNNGIQIATSGNYAYVVRNGGTNFLVLDVSNPASPSLVGSLTLTNTLTDITVSGNYAYVTGTSDSAELQVVDISNPASPSLAATLNMSGNGNGLAVDVAGSYAYATRASDAASNEFNVVNIATPTSPTVAGGYNNNIDMNDVVVNGNYAFVGTNSNTQEILAVNIATPASPTLAATLDLSGNGAVSALALYNNTLFAARLTTIVSINVTTPTSPSTLGTVTSTGSATVNDICVESGGTYLFAGTNNSTAEFQVVNISSPASMSVVRTVSTSSTINGVAYNSSLDIVVGATAADTQEAVTFTKN